MEMVEMMVEEEKIFPYLFSFFLLLISLFFSFFFLLFFFEYFKISEEFT